ncbi:hypothetical protein BLX24_19965 [Arsenicibacter rosenii]|uniref:D-alanine--D-alanine ligase n=1 Tax=Arsenicibacter rosenii TaxID=1750698 RepID=A0A1S2VFP0_9BACT|nr:hypothetical protein BLX24_19965 [Arsenicibacter rosenii]
MIRLTAWEYWPFSIVYIPVFIYWLWLSLRARSFFFFSASNPSIETGGLMGESKWDILKNINPAFLPQTLFVSVADTSAETLEFMVRSRFRFPVIAKPDVGERGWRVEKINTADELKDYFLSAPGDFLIQDYVDEPLEFGVFYYRFPGKTQGVVSSIVQKEFLSIRGDGQTSIGDLILQNSRAVLQRKALAEKFGTKLHEVLGNGQELQLVAIGNHSRGTKFLNAGSLISPHVTRLFDSISRDVDGFYFGRYDIRCRSINDLSTGEHLRILELNGAGAEPAHIYHPGFPLWRAWQVLLFHWKILFQISQENHRRGHAYMTLSEARVFWKKSRSKNKHKPL